jgi:hypothetical protein
MTKHSNTTDFFRMQNSHFRNIRNQKRKVNRRSVSDPNLNQLSLSQARAAPLRARASHIGAQLPTSPQKSRASTPPPRILLHNLPSHQSTAKMSQHIQKLAASASRQMNAVVVSSGLMNKTVKVRIGVQKWNKHIQKVHPPFPKPLPQTPFKLAFALHLSQFERANARNRISTKQPTS